MGVSVESRLTHIQIGQGDAPSHPARVWMGVESGEMWVGEGQGWLGGGSFAQARSSLNRWSVSRISGRGGGVVLVCDDSFHGSLHFTILIFSFTEDCRGRNIPIVGPSLPVLEDRPRFNSEIPGNDVRLEHV